MMQRRGFVRIGGCRGACGLVGDAEAWRSWTSNTVENTSVWRSRVSRMVLTTVMKAAWRSLARARASLITMVLQDDRGGSAGLNFLFF